MNLQLPPSFQRYNKECKPHFAGKNSQAEVVKVPRPLLFNQDTVSFSEPDSDGLLVSPVGSLEEAGPAPVLYGSELLGTLTEQAPDLARWFKPPHYKPGDKVEFLLLAQALSRGVDASLRQANAKKKHTGPKGANGSGVSPIDVFLPPAMKGKLDRAQGVSLLTGAQRQLKALKGPDSPAALQAASDESGRLLRRFLDSPDSTGKTPTTFVQFLMADSLQGDSEPAKAALAGQQVLKDLWVSAEDQTALMQDQFARECPTLLKQGQNLVKRGQNGQLPEALMRREVTERMLAIIQGGGPRTNILLNAPAGEGKTYAAMALAQRLASNDVPKDLQGAQMVQLDLSSLFTEGFSRGEGGDRKAKEIFSQLSQYMNQHPRQKVVVFINNLHQAAPDEGGGLMDLMKSSGVLGKKNLTFIGTTTPDDWRKSALSSDQAVLGRFHTMTLPRFTHEQRLVILGRQAAQLEKQNNVEIPPDILEKVLREASARWPEQALPRAIDLLNLSASISRGGSLELAALKDQLQQKELWLKTLSEKKTMKGRFERQQATVKQEVEHLRAEVEKQSGSKSAFRSATAEPEVIRERHLRQAMAVLSGDPVETLSRDELGRLRNAREVLGRHIIGQPEALSVIEEGLREIAIRHKTGAVRNRPIVSMLLPGPTGVGKTEVAKVIAKEFMKNKQIIRLDMGEYKDKHSVYSLKGAPPSYVGFEQGGLLDQVQQKPHSVVVFDEIEKAHPDVFDILLPILDEGEGVNNRGEVVSFRDTVIILTSNLNQKELTEKITQHRKASPAVQDAQLAASQLEQAVRTLLTANAATGKPGFKPEHLGRIDYVIPFNPLSSQHVAQIVALRLREMNDEAFLRDKNVQVTLSEAAGRRLVDLSSAGSADNQLQGGARDVRSQFDRQIYKMVMAELAMNPDWDELENAVLQVNYDNRTHRFELKAVPKAVEYMPKSASNQPRFGRTLAFA